MSQFDTNTKKEHKGALFILQFVSYQAFTALFGRFGEQSLR